MCLSDQIAIMNWWVEQHPNCAVNHVPVELVDHFWFENHRAHTHNAMSVRFRKGWADGVLHGLITSYQRSDAGRFQFAIVAEWEDIVAKYNQIVGLVDEPVYGANLEDVL